MTFFGVLIHLRNMWTQIEHDCLKFYKILIFEEKWCFINSLLVFLKKSKIFRNVYEFLLEQNLFWTSWRACSLTCKKLGWCSI